MAIEAHVKNVLDPLLFINKICFSESINGQILSFRAFIDKIIPVYISQFNCLRCLYLVADIESNAYHWFPHVYFLCNP